MNAGKNNHITCGFILAEVPVKWSNPAGGSIGVTDGAGAPLTNGQYVKVGTQLLITAKPNSANYELAMLLVDGTAVENGASYIANAEVNISATFDYVGDVPQGPEGPQGPQGPSGPRGPSGPVGTDIDDDDVPLGEWGQVPYYFDENGNRVFIGFAYNANQGANWNEHDYISPEGEEVRFINNSKTFIDIEGHWAEEYINFVAEREVFIGMANSLFGPDTTLTRAMFITIMGRLYERSYGFVEPSGEKVFTDCDYNEYYAKYLEWATEAEIILGYGDGLFGPNDEITREQMALIIFRFAKYLEVTPDELDTTLLYTDSNAIANWATQGALFCQSADLVLDPEFRPQAIATRAEAAELLTRFITFVVTRNNAQRS